MGQEDATPVDIDIDFAGDDEGVEADAAFEIRFPTQKRPVMREVGSGAVEMKRSA